MQIDPRALGIVSTIVFVAYLAFTKLAAFSPVLLAVAFFTFMMWQASPEEYVPDAPGELVVKNDVQVVRTLPPKVLGFYKGITDALARLEEVKFYEVGAYETIVTLLERYFRLYERVMVGTAPCSDIARMVDIKTEVLNTMHSFVFNVSTRYNATIEEITSEIHAIMYHFLKIARRRCTHEPDTPDITLPHGFDPTKSPHDLY